MHTHNTVYVHDINSHDTNIIKRICRNFRGMHISQSSHSFPETELSNMGGHETLNTQDVIRNKSCTMI